MSEGLCLDTGALIAFERRDRRVVRLVELTRKRGWSVHVPAPVVAQARRAGSRQALLARLLSSDGVETVALDALAARSVGELCAATSATDIVDGHVAWHAFRHGLIVVTSDPAALAAFGLSLRIVAV